MTASEGGRIEKMYWVDEMPNETINEENCFLQHEDNFYQIMKLFSVFRMKMNPLLMQIMLIKVRENVEITLGW